MTSNQARLMRHFISYPRSWHAIGQDSRRVASSLADCGLIESDDSRPRRYRLALSEDVRAILERESAAVACLASLVAGNYGQPGGVHVPALDGARAILESA